jgi:hypothetical protein
MSGRMVAAGTLCVALLTGCAATATADRATSPQDSAPDPSTLQLAVNNDFRPTPIGMSGSVVIIPVSCAAGVTWHGNFYVLGSDGLKDLPDPQPAEPVDGVVLPGCNDTGGTEEPDQPVHAWTIQGIDPDQGILVQVP